ncbi:MAG: PAS domain S-box protein [Desulfobacteraceae bacterium]
MTVQSTDPNISSQFCLLSTALCVVIILTGCSVLTGWWLDISLLKSIHPNWVTMKANTALSFIFLGFATWLLNCDSSNHSLNLRACMLFSFLTMLVSLATLFQYTGDWNFGIDNLLFREPAGAFQTSSPGRMAPVTAFNFISVSIALFLQSLNERRGKRFTHLILLIPFAISFLSILGYLYGIQSLYRLSDYTSMALSTAVSFLILSIAVFLSCSENRWLKLISGDTMGGTLARRLLPIIMILIPLLFWLRLLGEKAGYYNAEFGISLMVLASILILSRIILWSADSLHTTEVKRREIENVLKENESRYRNLFMSSPDAIFVNKQNEIILANNACQKLFGVKSSRDLIGKSPSNLFHPDFHPVIEKRIQRVLDHHESTPPIEEQITRFDGGIVDVEVVAAPFQFKGESLVHVILHDISRRKKAESELKANREQWKFLASSSPSVIYTAILNQHFTLTFVTPNITAQVGYKPDEFYQDPQFWSNHLHPEDAPGVLSDISRIKEDEKQIHEYRFLHKDGTYQWIRDEMKLIDSSDSKTGASRIIGSWLNISDRKDAEEKLAASEQRYRTLFNGTAEGILVADSQTRELLYANPAICKMLGYTEHELCRVKVGNILPEEHEDELLELFERHAKGEKSREIGLPLLHKDGALVQMDVNSTPIEMDGKSCLAGFFTDRSERVRLETEKEDLEAQLQQVRRLEAVGRLAGGVAHDFNNLLTGIKGFSGFALDEAEPGTQLHEDLNEVISLADRAGSLIQQLLAFSRKQALSMEDIDINKLVSEHLKMLERLLGEDIDIRFNESEKPGIVKADPSQMSQVLMNMALNARDAMPDGGKLTIESADVDLKREYTDLHKEARQGPHVMIAVSDNGVGMDENTRSHIFDPFFTTKSQGEGTGLGLSTVYGIIKQHGGNVWVYSEPGRGTTFRIYLPRITSESKPAPKKEDIVQGGTETILLVEDEEAVCNVMSRHLESFGYNVICASNPEEARKHAKTYVKEIDLLLSDVVMPGGSGLELYKSLSEEIADFKVLFMSGYTDSAIVHQGILKEGVAFLEKPVERNILAAKVREVLDKEA